MKPILIIDAGHGGKDPGGGSSIFYDPNGFYEKDMVLEISLYQHRRFKELGVSVSLTRAEDVTVDSAGRTKTVRDSGAKYCISNHINAASNTSARGVETIHSIFSNEKLAHALFQAIRDEGMASRRVFCLEGSGGKDYYFMHRETGSVETVIIEYGFATNVEDSKLLLVNWQQYAEAVVRGFCHFINHPYFLPKQTEKEAHSDVPRVHWAHSDIQTVHGAGIMTGYPDGTFKPDQPITRAEMAAVVAKLLKRGVI